MKAKATIRLKFPSVKQLDTVKAALLPEVNKPSSGRSHVSMYSEDTFLILTVEAEDTVALRSTLNAYLRWIGSAASIVETLNKTS
jgi:tRNA threonylcarbamoyladenosine modification (KEOPS) complex  Pcc1 subunit